VAAFAPASAFPNITVTPGSVPLSVTVFAPTSAFPALSISNLGPGGQALTVVAFVSAPNFPALTFAPGLVALNVAAFVPASTFGVLTVAASAALTASSMSVELQILAAGLALVVVFQEISAEAATYSEGNLMTTVVRGSTVTFKANFTNEAGLPVNPAQASVFVSFPNPTGLRTTVEIALTQSGNDWTAQWDSGLSKPGTVSWSAHTKATTPAAATDGTFEVTANPANPEFLA
jgi:hypothetical protein